MNYNLPSPEEMIKQLGDLINKRNEKERLGDFFNNDYFSEFRKCINNEVSEIKNMEVKRSIKGAYLSACIKRYKRNIVKDYILKIALIEGLDLTQRIADLFFIECLGRSVGEFFLNEHFSGLQYKENKLTKIKRTSENIVLNPVKKEEVKGIIAKYKNQIIDSVEKIKCYFYEAKLY
ncbi:hypothetical protein AB6G22_20635 [Providencia hangzhouensis]|uniref:hypothetical protein n=1 Tax=Providencia TaxID=586 RepID=UPI00234AB9A1|nr:hypothetical protein [Providencia sp. PROV099]WOB97723.1 hypothetical protein P3L54_23060 [Providencia sp. PROV099]